MNPKVYRNSKLAGRASVGFDTDMGAPTIEVEVFDQYTGEPAGIHREHANIPDLKDQLTTAQEIVTTLQELIADLESAVPTEFDHIKTRGQAPPKSGVGPR